MSSHLSLDAGLVEAGQDVEDVLVTGAAAHEAGLESSSGSEEAVRQPTSGRSRVSIAFALVGAAAVAASVAFIGRGGSAVGKAAASPRTWQEEDGILYAEPEVVKEGPFEEEFTELYNTYGYNPSSSNYVGKPMTTSSSSSFIDCVLCSPNQCTLDYSGMGHWSSCPANAKYFSKSHCGCVSSLSQCTGKQASCSQLCVDCYTGGKSCYGNGKANKCGSSTPYYMATRNVCASSCSPAPGPAPKPEWSANSLIGPAPGPYSPAPAPSGSKKPSGAPAPSGSEKPSTGGKTPSGKCEKSTGGSCMMSNCATSRGQVECGSMYKCTCKKGYCADKKGVCVAEGTSSASSTKISSSSIKKMECKAETGGSCMVTNCASSRGTGVECKSQSCVCKKGYCADSKGVCKILKPATVTSTVR